MSALKLVNELIAKVESMPAAGSAASTGAGAGPQRVTSDVYYWPLVPLGHSAYSWGVQPSSNNGVSAAPTAAPATSNGNTTVVSAPASSGAAAAGAVKEQKAAKAAASKKAAVEEKKSEEDPNQPDISKLDIRVGRVVKAERHPDADSLYIEQIDVGEAEPRTIVSGLVKFISQEELAQSWLLVVCNLKPAPLRNVKSYGMVLAAGNADRSVVELVTPPAGCVPGERVTFAGMELSQYKPVAEVDPKKKVNAWLSVKDLLKTNEQCEAQFNGHSIMTSKGVCKSKSLSNASIS